MDANRYLGSANYLKKEDFDRPHVCTITQAKEVEVDDQEKLALSLSGCKKSLLLNATNLKRLMGFFGRETEGWIGQTIEIYVDPNVEMKGAIVGGIRVREYKPEVPNPQLAGAAVSSMPPPPASAAGKAPLEIKEIWKEHIALLAKLDSYGENPAQYEQEPTAEYHQLILANHAIENRLKELQLRNKPDFTARNSPR